MSTRSQLATPCRDSIVELVDKVEDGKDWMVREPLPRAVACHACQFLEDMLFALMKAIKAFLHLLVHRGATMVDNTCVEI